MCQNPKARSWLARTPRLVLWAGLAACSGCLGGQTGTEATPSDAGTTTGTKGDTTTTPPTEQTAVPATDPRCAVPPSSAADLQEQTGITEVAVVEFVQSSNPVKFRYDDGSIAGATLTIAMVAAGCQSVTSSGPASLSVPVLVQITSDDGRVNQSLPGTAVAYAAAGGGVAEVEITGVAQCLRAAGAVAMAPCAMIGIDTSQYAAMSVGLSARAQSIGGATEWLGTLRISGSATGGCSPTPCSIADWATVATMSLSSSL